VGQKMRGHFIFCYKSRNFWSNFELFVPLKTVMKTLQNEDSTISIYLLNYAMTS